MVKLGAWYGANSGTYNFVGAHPWLVHDGCFFWKFKFDRDSYCSYTTDVGFRPLGNYYNNYIFVRRCGDKATYTYVQLANDCTDVCWDRLNSVDLEHDKCHTN